MLRDVIIIIINTAELTNQIICGEAQYWAKYGKCKGVCIQFQTAQKTQLFKPQSK